MRDDAKRNGQEHVNFNRGRRMEYLIPQGELVGVQYSTSTLTNPRQTPFLVLSIPFPPFSLALDLFLSTLLFVSSSFVSVWKMRAQNLTDEPSSVFSHTQTANKVSNHLLRMHASHSTHAASACFPASWVGVILFTSIQRTPVATRNHVSVYTIRI